MGKQAKPKAAAQELNQEPQKVTVIVPGHLELKNAYLRKNKTTQTRPIIYHVNAGSVPALNQGGVKCQANEGSIQTSRLNVAG